MKGKMYGISEAADQLGMQKSILRNYVRLLKEQGYSIAVNEKGYHKLSDTDLEVIKKVQKEYESSMVSVYASVEKVIGDQDNSCVS
ncbi:hypothetical protein ACJ2A9_01190 [Anaerobacillus sp. MEB173]|uniref:hypothetical protein n=1 Tax=Anaerobacillus sp. MEB173 TaxID=3383345 RepID=UPI003F91768B